MPDDKKRRRRWRTGVATQVRARQLRQEQTLAEAKLWYHLRDRRLDSFKFRRQHPIGRFVVDFCCPERHLIIEIDGPIHEGQVEYDQARLRRYRAAVLRRAFAGRLVPQDPGDEPASALLKRIRRERQDQSGRQAMKQTRMEL